MNATDLMAKIMKEAPSFKANGVKYYIVECDQKIRADQLMAYAQEVAAIHDPENPTEPSQAERLTIATVDDRMIRWKVPARLTWAIKEESFGKHSEWLESAYQICRKATEDWNNAAEAEGISDSIIFEEVPLDTSPVFTYELNEDLGGYLALAFFPHNLPAERIVYLAPKIFEGLRKTDPAGVIRHELGHVIGARHEFIRSEADVDVEQWTIGKLSAEAITEFDHQSVMHYPQYGFGTRKFEISELDQKGFGELYRRDSSDPSIKEFPI